MVAGGAGNVLGICDLHPFASLPELWISWLQFIPRRDGC
jgi:hypothetical protein